MACISRMISGSFERGTTASCRSQLGVMRPDDAGRLLAPLPEQRPLGLVLGHADLERGVIAADRHDARRPGPRSPPRGPSSSISSTAPAPLG